MKKCTFTTAVFLVLISVSALYAAEQGDVNDDSRVTIVDALMTAQYAVGLQPPGFLTSQADVNCDGAVTIIDALMIAQHSVGLGTPFCTGESEAIAFVNSMGIGWNLGNSLEACGDWINPGSISNFETAWGNPMTTKAMFEGIRNEGFKSVRIPVAWSNLMEENFTIHTPLMERVVEVVNYALSSDLYAIINIHWDGGWIANFSTQYETSMQRYESFWTQISTRFRDFPETLIFESLNEEGCWNDIWNRYGGDSSTKADAYNILNNINQNFVNLIRSSGGGNNNRYLLIAGYATDVDLTCDQAFHMPHDPAGHCIVSVHYYTPSTFTILEEDADWGQMAPTWGTSAEIAVLKNDFNKLKTRFTDNGIPVILGEYGTVLKNKEPESVYKYLTEVASTAYSITGICPMLWDNGAFFDRYSHAFTDRQLADFYAGLAATPR